MRPASIVYFERLSILSILVGIAFTFLTWDSDVKVAPDANLGTAFVPVVQGISLAILLLLIFLISRAASVIAKWILVVLFVLGILFMAPMLPQALGQGLVGLLQLSQLVVQAAALYFLFTPEA